MRGGGWRLLAFAFGASIGCNTLLPVGANLRILDVVSIGSLIAFGWSAIAGRRIERAALVLAVVLLVSLEWAAAEAWVSGLRVADPKVQIVLLRWMLGCFAAYWLYVQASEPRLRKALFLGTIAGSLAALATVVYDFQTFDLTVNMPGLNLADLAFVDGIYRAQGMFTHPNEAAGVILLCAPLIIGLVEERRLPRLSLLVLAVIMGTVFWVTKSRSQFVIVLILLAVWALRNAPQLLLAIAAAALVALVAGAFDLLPFVSGDVIADRLFNSDLGDNAGDRLATITESIAIALSYPFGAGSIYVEMLARETGFTATHNALMQLAVMGGLPLMVVMLSGLLRCAFTVFRNSVWRVEGWLALYLICVFNVENYFYSSEMSIMTQFVVAVAWSRRAIPAPAESARAEADLPALAPPRRPALPGPGLRPGTRRPALRSGSRRLEVKAGQ